ncbi:MAG: ABC transporter permease [Anaerolineae bacterium]
MKMNPASRESDGVVSRLKESSSNRRSEFRRTLLAIQRSKSTIVGIVLTAVFLFIALFAPCLAPHDPLKGNLANRLAPPSVVHPLGTDSTGRDLLSRIIYGARTSMWIGLTATGAAMVSGVFLGMMSAFYGGAFEMLGMRLVDILLTFPSLILAIALASVLGMGRTNVIIAVAVSMFPVFARLARSTVLAVKGNEYVMAAQAVGVQDWRLMTRHLLPNSWGPIIVQATLGIGMAVLAAASLSFLGIGVQPPEAEWGSMLSQARQYIRYAPHFIAFPGATLALFVLGFNLLGDGLRDLLDPRLRGEA